jgi:MFS family permease
VISSGREDFDFFSKESKKILFDCFFQVFMSLQQEAPGALDNSRNAFICNFPVDGIITFLTRSLRMFNYGAITPVLFLYCKEIGLSELQTGVLISLILAGDLIITLFLSTRADTMIGRRRTLVIGAALKIFAGLSFAFSTQYYILVIAGTIGVISSSIDLSNTQHR